MRLDSLKQQAFTLLGFILLIMHSTIFAQGDSDLLNHAPVVKIVKPKNDTEIEWGKFIRYKIKVSDQEDGESKFHEIPSDEVFLKIRYLSDASAAEQNEKQITEMDSLGLFLIKESNCLNCHQFHSKSIGPSFTTISHHYKNTEENKESLQQHIKDGSSGIWGSAAMPSHTGLTERELTNIVHWIMNRVGNPKINYYTGTEGAFKMESPTEPGTHAGLKLSASYIDHGTGDQPKTRLKGLDTLIIYGK